MIQAFTVVLIFGQGCSKVKFEEINQASQKSDALDLPSSDPDAPHPRVEKAEEKFQQSVPNTSNSKVDILFVEDTSLSMREERWVMHKKFSKMFSHLSGMDWQMGITTTDEELKGELVETEFSYKKVLKQQGSYKRDFIDTIGFDMCNDDDSDGWFTSPCGPADDEPLKLSLKAFQNASALYRQDADLAIVYLTDQEEKSGVSGATKADDVINGFKSKFSGKTMRAYGAVIQPGDTACFKQERGYGKDPNGGYNHSVTELAKKTGGITVSICSADYSDLFKSIKEDFSKVSSQPLFNSVILKHDPIAESVKVTFTPSTSIQTHVVGRTVFFSEVPPVGVEIRINYNYVK